MVLVELEPLVTSDIVVCLDALGGGSLGRSVVNRNGKKKGNAASRSGHRSAQKGVGVV